MYYIYLLLSLKDHGYYIGYSSDLKRRQQDHQDGKVEATKYRKPLKLIYYEAYSTESAARERERKLKEFGSSYHGLLKRLGSK